jgi:stearoyl-CoA desaturase (delta-9 desaturase)
MLSLTPKTLLASQILAHLSLVWMIFYGTPLMWAITVFVYFLNGCLGMTMTYHRLLSHKAWNPPKWIEYTFAYLAGIGLTGSAISWVSIHRKHHRYTDKSEDPHSPKYKGWFYCHFLSMFSNVDAKYAVDLLRQDFYTKQHRYYFLMATVWGLSVSVVFWDPYALIYAWLAPAAILWNAGSTIVSYSHRKGTVFNDTWLGILVWGEGYHANHHDKPGSARFGKYDLGGILIEFFKKWNKPKPLGEVS